MKTEIRSVPPQQLPAVYEKVRQHFESFMERAHGGIPAGSLEMDIMQEKRQCYVVARGEEILACFLTQVAPNGDIGLTHCAGRDADEWAADVLGMCEAWAAETGGGVVAYCRTGWVRKAKMAERGYRETHRVMELR